MKQGRIYLRNTPEFSLFREDKKYFAEMKWETQPHQPQEIDERTAEALFQHGPSRLVADGIDAGLVLDAPIQFAELKERRSIVRNFIRPDERPLSVFIDTTTVHNAQRALAGDINAVFLVDLAIVAFASVMYDEIILLQHPGVGDLPDYFKKRVRPSRDFADVYFKGLLNGVVSEAEGSPNGKQPPLAELQEAWEDFLKLEKGSIKLNLWSFDQHQDSQHWDGLVGAGFFGEDREVYADQQSSIIRFIEAQTVRTLFNSRLAGIAGIPYLASSLRNPVHCALLARGLDLSSAQDVIISRLKPTALSGLPKTPAREAISLPLMLGIVLKDRELTGIGRFWNVLKKYRDLAAPLRQDIRDFQRNDATPSQVAQRYLSWVYDEIPRHVIDSAVTATEKGLNAALYAIPPVSASTTAVSAILALIKLATKPIIRAVAPQLNPALHVVFRLDEEARGLIDLQAQIANVWGKQINRRDLEQLHRLTQTNPNRHLLLRQL